MTKDDVITNIVSHTSVSRNEAKEIVTLIIDSLMTSVEKERKLLITKFGVFQLKRKKSRIGRNPVSRQEYNIDERNVVNFLSSRSFRKSMPRLSNPKV